MPNGRPASAPTVPSTGEGPACYKVLPGTGLNLLPGSFLPPSFGNREEQWGGEAPAHPICTHSPGPKSSLHFSVVLPLTTLTRRNDTFLRLVEPTFTDICCTDTQRCADTHPRYTLTNQPTQRNTHNTLDLGDTFNNTNVPTDTNTQACEGARTRACAHTHPTST